MMDDSVSIQAAIDALAQIFDRCEEIEAHLPEGDPDRTGYKMYPDYITVWKYLHQLPSAQPEIVRCKDCKYMTEYYDTYGNAPYWTCSEWNSWTDYDGFCHHAERRTDGVDPQESSDKE